MEAYLSKSMCWRDLRVTLKPMTECGRRFPPPETAFKDDPFCAQCTMWQIMVRVLEVNTQSWRQAITQKTATRVPANLTARAVANIFRVKLYRRGRSVTGSTNIYYLRASIEDVSL